MAVQHGVADYELENELASELASEPTNQWIRFAPPRQQANEQATMYGAVVRRLSRTGIIAILLLVLAAASAEAGTGVALWRQGTAVSPRHCDWDGSSFDAPSATKAVGIWRIIQGAEAPTRSERIVLGVDESREIDGLMHNGSSWSTLPFNSMASVSESYWWGFEVAYESQSGDAVIVHNGGMGSQAVHYRVWDGSDWSALDSIVLPYFGEVKHMQMASSPVANEMVLVVSNANSWDVAYVWDGVAWGDSITLDTGAGDDRTDIYVTYESQSGDAMVSYGKATDSVYYRMWDGSAWSGEGALFRPAGASGHVRWTTLASDPSSDAIALGVVTNAQDHWVCVWNGTAWDSPLHVNSSANGINHPGIAVAFEGSSGEALACYGRSDNLLYRQYVSGAWGSEDSLPDFPGSVNSVFLDPHPSDDDVMLSFQDGSNQAYFVHWDGTTWGSVDTLATNTSEDKNQPFLFIWDVGGIDLAVGMGVNSGLASEGDTLVYTVTVANHGTETATDVHVTNLLPSALTHVFDSTTHGTYVDGSGQWDIGTLSGGSTATLVTRASVGPGANGTWLTSEAYLSAMDQTDVNPANDMSTTSVYVKVGEFQMESGSYQGDGSSMQSISDLGFSPDFVIIKGDIDEPSAAKSRTMAGELSKVLGKNDPVSVDGITSIDVDGFTVGEGPAVNSLGTDYYWVAFQADNTNMAVGSYVGDGEDDVSITSVGFQPSYVIVMSESGEHAMQRFASEDVDKSFEFKGSSEKTDRIQAFESTGFQIGHHNTVNDAGVVYHFVAWRSIAGRIAEGAYVGTGVDGDTIAGIGFEPDAVFVKRNGGSSGVLKTPSMTGDGSLLFDKDLLFADGIQALTPDGFEIGTTDPVNKAGDTYFWFSFRENTTPILSAVADTSIAEGQGLSISIAATDPDGTIPSLSAEDVPLNASFLDNGDGTGVLDFTPSYTQEGVYTVRIIADDTELADTLSFQITVTPAPIVSIDVTPDSTSAEELTSVQFAASGYDAGSEFVSDVSGLATWTTTDPSGSVDAAGLYTAGNVLSPPQYYVRAEYMGSMVDSGAVVVVTSGDLSYVRIETDGGTPLGDTLLTTDNDSTVVYCRGYDSGDGPLGMFTATWSVIGGDGIGTMSPASGTSATLSLSAIGTGQIVASVSPAVADTTGTITVTPGVAAEFVITPSTATVTTDSVLSFTAVSVDADGNPTDPQVVPTWSVLNGVGNIDVSGLFDPTAVGTGYIVASGAGVVDTTDEIAVTAGALSYLVVMPDTVVVEINDSVLFNAAGFDADANPTSAGEIEWYVSSELGAIDSTGLFVAQGGGSGAVSAVSSIGGVFDATDFLAVEALTVSTIPIGQTSARPGDDFVPLLALRVDNSFLDDKNLEQVTIRDASTGAGALAERITNYRSLSLFVDFDGDSLLTASDSVLADTVVDGLATNLAFSPLSIPSGSGSVFFVGGTISTQARDGDSLDVYMHPGLDMTFTEGDSPTAPDSVNSLGLVILDGMVVDQVDVVATGTTEMSPGDSVYNVLTVDVPRNGYSADTLRALSVENNGTATNHDMATLALYADEGSGSWDGAEAENLIGELVFTGDRWVLSGIGVALAAPKTRLYIGASTSEYPSNGATLALAIPVNGLEVASDNDGPLDSPTAVVDTIGISSDDALQVDALAHSVRALIPGQSSGPVFSVRLTNGTGGVVGLDSIRFRLDANDPDGATQAQLDSQIDSVQLLLEGDGDITEVSSTDSLLGSALITNGLFVADLGGLTIAANGEEAVLTLIVYLDGQNSKDNNTLGFSTAAATDIYTSPSVSIVGDFPLESAGSFWIEAFTAAAVTVNATEDISLSGGAIDRLVLDLVVPANGYSADELTACRIENLGTVEDLSALSSLKLWADRGSAGFDAAEDSLLGAYAPTGNGWELNGLSYSVPAGGERLYVTASAADGMFSAGSLEPSIPVGGLEYASGMDGPDDVAIASTADIFVYPSDNVTAVSIPLPTATILPGTANHTLFSFALYNGYVGEIRHLNGVRFTNGTATASSADWADQQLGQVRVFFDSNRNRVLDSDSLVGSGIFSNGKLIVAGLDVSLPPESLSYFFVTLDCPLSAIDNDSLAVLISKPTDFAFAENTRLNGDLPSTRGGYLVVDGSVHAQYEVYPGTSRSISESDTNVVLMAFKPAGNGDLADTLSGLSVSNQYTADNNDFGDLHLWVDVNGDRAWQSTDSLVCALTHDGSAWSASGIGLETSAQSSPLLITGTVTDSAITGRLFRAQIHVNGCEFASGNDGPIDAPLTGSATFTISSSALSVSYAAMSNSYSVGQTIAVSLRATNLIGLELDSVLGDLSWTGDVAAVSLDSSRSGPVDMTAYAQHTFDYYFTAAQPGAVVFHSLAMAGVTGDSSATITSDTVFIQHAPSGAVAELNSYMPTSVAAGQQNVFPLSLIFSHPDAAGTAPIEVQSISVTTLTSTGIQQPADAALSRVVIVRSNNPLCVIDTVGTDPSLAMVLDPAVRLLPGDTAELILLADIADSASAENLILGLESASHVQAVDANTGSAITVTPVGTMPLRTAPCQIDDVASTLAVANLSHTLPGVNIGQDNASLLTVGLRHPGASGASLAQVVGLTLLFRDALGTVLPADVTDRVAILRSTELLGEAVGDDLLGSYVTVDLSSGLTINPGASDSLTVSVSIRPDAAIDSFSVSIPDSTSLVIRDVASGLAVEAITDRDILATGSVFPLASPVYTVFEPPDSVSYCIADELPSQVTAGMHGLDLLTVSCAHDQSGAAAPIRMSGIGITIVDSAGTPLDPGRLFDRTGYRVGGGSLQYHAGLTYVQGQLVFSLGDSGIMVAPGESVDVQLAVDLENDTPYEDFRLMLLDSRQLGLLDVVDTTNQIRVVPSWQCGGALPFFGSLAAVLLPAGEPRLLASTSGVQVTGAGQPGSVVGDLQLSYQGGVPRGAIELVSVECLLISRTGGESRSFDPSSLFSRISLVHDQATVAVDSTFDGGVVTLTADAPLTIPHQTDASLQFLADIRSDAPEGVFDVRLVDSSALQLRDVNLATGVAADLVSGEYPMVLGTFSVAATGLKASLSNFPNPFTPSTGPTTIAYVLSEDARVDIEIFTITGEPVAQIAANEYRPAGAHQDQTWDAINDAGHRVISGTYFLRVTANYLSGRTETIRRKVAVLR